MKYVIDLLRFFPFVLALFFSSHKEIVAQSHSLLKAYFLLALLFIPLSISVNLIIKTFSENKNSTGEKPSTKEACFFYARLICCFLAMIVALQLLRLHLTDITFYIIVIMMMLKAAELRFAKKILPYLFLVFIFDTIAGCVSFRLLRIYNIDIVLMCSIPLALMTTSVYLAQYIETQFKKLTNTEKNNRKAKRLSEPLLEVPLSLVRFSKGYAGLIIAAPSLIGILIPLHILSVYYQATLLTILAALPVINQLYKTPKTAILPRHFTLKSAGLCALFVVMLGVAATLEQLYPFL
ncbi:MAG: hypothetical protein ACOX2O_05705 [Bdellovibrionota bacterium]|jgi:hypothetical protein